MTELPRLVNLPLGVPGTPVCFATHSRDIGSWSLLIVFGKSLTTVATGFSFPYPARTSLVVPAGLSQTGEFSFIPGVLDTPT